MTQDPPRLRPADPDRQTIAVTGTAPSAERPSWTILAPIAQATQGDAIRAAHAILESLAHVPELVPHQARVRRTDLPHDYGMPVYCSVPGCNQPTDHEGACG